jgi:hypothetical protein
MEEGTRRRRRRSAAAPPLAPSRTAAPACGRAPTSNCQISHCISGLSTLLRPLLFKNASDLKHNDLTFFFLLKHKFLSFSSLSRERERRLHARFLHGRKKLQFYSEGMGAGTSSSFIVSFSGYPAAAAAAAAVPQTPPRDSSSSPFLRLSESSQHSFFPYLFFLFYNSFSNT